MLWEIGVRGLALPVPSMLPEGRRRDTCTIGAQRAPGTIPIDQRVVPIPVRKSESQSFSHWVSSGFILD